MRGVGEGRKFVRDEERMLINSCYSNMEGREIWMNYCWFIILWVKGDQYEEFEGCDYKFVPIKMITCSMFKVSFSSKVEIGFCTTFSQ